MRIKNPKSISCEAMSSTSTPPSAYDRSPLTERTLVEGATSFFNRRLSLHGFVAAFIVCDCISLIFWGLVIAFATATPTGEAVADWQKSAIIFAVGAQLLFSGNFNLYRTQRILSLSHAARRLPLTFLTTFAIMLSIAVATKTAETYSRLWFFSWALVSLSFSLGVRYVALAQARRALSKGAFINKALSVGVFCEPVPAHELSAQLGGEARVVASLRLSDIGELVSLADAIVHDEIDQIYICAKWVDIPAVLRNIDLLRHLAARVFVMAEDSHVRANVLSVSMVADRLSLCAAEAPIQGWSLWVKRAEDLVLSGLAFVALAPVIALVALAIKLDSPGPVYFRQTRVGFNGRTFQLWKFRSMYADQSDLHAKVQTSRDDPRVTRVGRFIRRTSIDELPQLFNVLEGTMSIVGPRPHALMTRTHGRNLDEWVADYAARHRVKPGMTGWAQVHGFRGELNSVQKLQNRVDYDIAYIDRWTIWLDIYIIWKTILVVFRDSSAY